MRRTLTTVTLTAALAATLLTAGCSMRDAICGADHYPVKSVGTTDGGDCVPEGKEPSAGYVRYPEGKVPGRPSAADSSSSMHTDHQTALGS